MALITIHASPKRVNSIEPGHVSVKPRNRLAIPVRHGPNPPEPLPHRQLEK